MPITEPENAKIMASNWKVGRCNAPSYTTQDCEFLLDCPCPAETRDSDQTSWRRERPFSHIPVLHGTCTSLCIGRSRTSLCSTAPAHPCALGFSPNSISKVRIYHCQINNKGPWWGLYCLLAVGAVCCEPVSADFPDRRENTGEKRAFPTFHCPPLSAILCFNNHFLLSSYSLRNQEQGINREIIGARRTAPCIQALMVDWRPLDPGDWPGPKPSRTRPPGLYHR